MVRHISHKLKGVKHFTILILIIKNRTNTRIFHCNCMRHNHPNHNRNMVQRNSLYIKSITNISYKVQHVSNCVSNLTL